VTSPSFGCPLPLVLVRKLGRKLRPVDSTRGIGKPTRTTLRNQMIRSDEKQGNGRLECTGVYPLGPLTMTAPCLHVQESQLSLAVTSLLMWIGMKKTMVGSVIGALFDWLAKLITGWLLFCWLTVCSIQVVAPNLLGNSWTVPSTDRLIRPIWLLACLQHQLTCWRGVIWVAIRLRRPQLFTAQKFTTVVAMVFGTAP